MSKLLGKVAIVTASTEGIGFSIAKRLAVDGARVMISSRKQKNVDNALEKLRADKLDVDGVVCHVGNSTDRSNLVQETVKRFGSLNIVVANAGINPIFCPMLDITEEAWDKIFSVNVKSTFLLTKDAFPHLEKAGGGSVVFVSSITAYNPAEMLGAYSVSKTALLGLTKALTPQLARSNIRINTLCPGIIDTKFSAGLTAFSDQMLPLIPMNRFGQPDECAGVVSFLVSDDASYMTGECLVAAGGQMSHL